MQEVYSFSILCAKSVNTLVNELVNLPIERLHVTSCVQVVVYSPYEVYCEAGLPPTSPYKAAFKHGAHRCQLGWKRRQMVPRAAFQTTFDEQKRNRRAQSKFNGRIRKSCVFKNRYEVTLSDKQKERASSNG